jgi:RHS repeat-associated protein
VTDPLNRRTEYAYDAAGNLKELIDPLERTTSYEYDEANRLHKIKYSDGETPEAIFGYDEDNQLTSMSDGTGSSSFVYDELHRLKEATQQGIAVGFGYDLADNETRITYPGSHEVTRAFDKANRLESVTDWSSNKTSFGYDADSDLKSITFPSGTANVDEYSYDKADRLGAITMKKGEATVASLAYARDSLGQVEGEEQSGLPGAASTTYGYTPLNQLSSAGASEYGYSSADNATKLAGISGYEYDEANELNSIPPEAPGGAATLNYNALGERTELNPESGPSTEYSYDQAGRLTGVGAETYAYGGDGLRLSATTGEETKHFSWDRNSGLPLLLSDGSTRYIYGPGGLPVEQVSAGGTPTYYHHDQLGSTRMLTNASGEVTDAFSYAPYGALAGSTGEQTTPLGFAGQYTDPGSGLQYLRARYLDPATGQFVSRDPLTAMTRVPYAYAGESPFNGADPAGLATIGACWTVSGAVTGPFGITGSVCVQASTSGDVGVTASGGGQVAAGTPTAISGPGIEASNANHVSELEGPFIHIGGQAAAGVGGFAQGFAGETQCGKSIEGIMGGPVAGFGTGAEAGVTGTWQASTSAKSILETIGHALLPAWGTGY